MEKEIERLTGGERDLLEERETYWWRERLLLAASSPSM